MFLMPSAAVPSGTTLDPQWCHDCGVEGHSDNDDHDDDEWSMPDPFVDLVITELSRNQTIRTEVLGVPLILSWIDVDLVASVQTQDSMGKLLVIVNDRLVFFDYPERLGEAGWGTMSPVVRAFLQEVGAELGDAR